MYRGLIALLLSAIATQSQPPRDWTDASTGHRVIRLSEDSGTESLYFHQNGYTAKGDKLVVTTRAGLSTIDLGTRKIEPLVQGRVSHVVVGKNTRQAFYIKDGSVYSTDIDTRSTKAILQKRELSSGSGLTVNSDETMLGGSYVENGSQAPPVRPGESSLEVRWAAHLPMALYTIEIKTGKLTIFHHSTDWLNHVQFSPTDPDLLMFCHEGPWHKVDRIWTIRIDDTGLRKIHTRTMDMEIAGHEFFSPDGKIIWYDLQTPKAREFWLAGLALATGEQIRYKLERVEWPVHFNASPDGKVFAGDGGGPRSVAAPGNGQWIYLYRVENGALKSEKLVNLKDHDYTLEPNVTFTPDQKWIVFRSNMHGAPQVYAVEVQRN
jgi:oligogalacturonide lyase